MGFFPEIGHAETKARGFSVITLSFLRRLKSLRPSIESFLHLSITNVLQDVKTYPNFDPDCHTSRTFIRWCLSDTQDVKRISLDKSWTEELVPKLRIASRKKKLRRSMQENTFQTQKRKGIQF